MSIDSCVQNGLQTAVDFCRRAEAFTTAAFNKSYCGIVESDGWGALGGGGGLRRRGQSGLGGERRCGRVAWQQQHLRLALAPRGGGGGGATGALGGGSGGIK